MAMDRRVAALLAMTGICRRGATGAFPVAASLRAKRLVIASEARQSRTGWERTAMDRRVAALLAMTGICRSGVTGAFLGAA